MIGRDDEIRRVVQVLARRTKNNPVLIGEPGMHICYVGHLARKIYCILMWFTLWLITMSDVLVI